MKFMSHSNLNYRYKYQFTICFELIQVTLKTYLKNSSYTKHMILAPFEAI